MAKILFVNPIVREEDVPRHIPYGMALLASIVINEGHDVQMYDANAWRKGFDVLEKVYQADNWDIICIGGLTTTYNFIKVACQLAKKHSPNSYLMAGGGFLTSMPRDMMKWIPEIDIGVLGESFITFPEVVNKIDKKDFDWTHTLGVVYRNDEEIIVTDSRPNIHNLDDIPWPAWHLFPLEEVYFKNSAQLYSEEQYYAKRRIDVNASFGCNLICKYCWHLGTTGDMVVKTNANGEKDVAFTYGRNIRYHSPDYIVEMVTYLRDKYKVDFISFLDENMMTMDVYSKRTWLEELCAKWIEGGLQPESRKHKVSYHDVENTGVFWSGTSHASLHRPEILSLMYDAGCTHLVYGLESFNKKILKNLGKGSSPKRNKESVKICLDSGIQPIPNIIIGFPDESFQSIRDNIEALLELGIHAKPHFATAYPGSEWYFHYKDSIMEQYNGDLEAYIKDLGDASKITGVISHQFSPADLLGLQEIVSQRDLRLLELTEKAWGESSSSRVPLAVPKASENIIQSKKEVTPMKEQKIKFFNKDEIKKMVGV